MEYPITLMLIATTMEVFPERFGRKPWRRMARLVDGRIDNYTDTDNDGIVRQNVDGSNSGVSGSGIGLGLPDLDGDGIPNYFDLDSDNDGIPDVREVLGTDANNDGMLDNFIDSDFDGLSDAADGDVGNDGTAENSANALLRTGADINADGRADSYPYKNFDSDSKANPYELDSDGDGITDVREAGFVDADNNGQSDGVKGLPAGVIQFLIH